MGWASTLIGQRTFKFWAIAGVLVVSMAALAGGIAYGTTASCSNPATLNGSAFEVDTNANLIVNTTGCIDWLNGGTGTALRSGVVAKNDAASGNADESFGNGTKEDTAVPSIVDGGIPPNKSDLKAFGVYSEQGAVTASNPTGKYLALFWTRVQDPSGTTNMDFELNQSSTKSSNGVTPVRTTGDKLITYDLSNGGTVASVSIRTWSGSAWGSPVVITGGSNPSALGSINTSLIPANQAGGATNGLTTQLGALDPRTFGEATISFSALFGQNTCGQFGSAYLKSRSSDSFTAALKDFVPPAAVNISNCAGLTTNATQSVTVGSPISDTASLTGVGATAGGTITFKAYGPNDANCTGTAAFTSTKTVLGPGNYTSDSFTPTAVGTYRWTADYSGDASNQSASSPCNAPNESSVVNQASPNIVTNATQSATIGSAISDTATLSGATTNAGGTITFKAYGPNDANCTGTAAYSNTVNVNGNGDYGSGNFTPTASGTYRWTADYSGDANNKAASSPCNAPNESSTVNPASPNIVTSATQSVTIGSAISDTATLSGATTNAGGTITFKAYGPNDANCTGTAAYSNTVNVSGNGDYGSGNFTPTASGTYRWTADYSGDSNNDDASSPCNAANETSTVNPAEPDIVTNATQSVTIGSPIKDTATLSGATTNAGGTITFKAYGPNDANCTGTAAYSNTVNVNGNGDYDSGNFTPTQVGTYRWTADYSGDANNDDASSPCNAPNESSLVNKAPANVNTAQELFPQDSATLSATAGGTPTGTVDFALYGPNDANCSGTPVYTQENVDLTSGTANTDNTSFSVDQAGSGNYKWIVHYDGDATHNEATSACGKEAFTATIDNDTTN